MSAVWARAFSELRRRRMVSLGLAVLIGLAGAVVMTAWAGARRTDSAYPRYLAATHAPDYLISSDDSGSSATYAFYRQVERLPQVERSGIAVGPSLVSETEGRPDADLETAVQTLASNDGRAGYTVDSVRVMAGRLPQPDRPYEALVNNALARRRHLRVGSRLTMYWTPPTAAPLGSDASPDQLRPVTFTITGIGATYDEVVPIATNDGAPSLFVTPAYDRMADIGPNVNFDGVFVRLRPGADRSLFIAEANRLVRSFEGQGNHFQGIFVADLSVHAARVQRAIHPEALALELFAGLVAIGALLAVGQVIAREVAVGSAEDPALRASGFERRQLVAVALLRLFPPIVLGALLAVGASIAASPLMPIGPARLAETHPGVSIDPLVLGLGSVALIGGFVAAGIWAAWRATAKRTSAGNEMAPLRRSSRAVEALGGLGLRPPALTGLRMAFEPGRGAAAVPVRSATAGVVAAVVAVVAVLTFSTNLGRLVSNPALFGDTWSFALDGQFNAMPAHDLLASVAHLPGIEAVAGGDYGDIATLDGKSVPVVGIDPLVGSVFPTIVRGHAPHSADDVVLGAKTMRQLHKQIGDQVTLLSQGRTHKLRIVGQVVLPSFGRGSFTPTDLGDGAVTVASAVAQAPADPGSYNFFLFEYARNVDASAVTGRLTAFAHSMGCPGDACLLSTARVLPSDVQSYNRVRSTPGVLAAILAVLGLAMIGHALVTSVRRRRRDLAVLKTLGFVKRDVAVAVAWQVSAFAVTGVVFGVPIGLALGRWLWSLFADQLGIPASTALPVLAAVVVPTVIVVSNAIAALPARSAARTRPALILRSE